MSLYPYFWAPLLLFAVLTLGGLVAFGLARNVFERPTDADQVKGRAPGSSDHALPIRRTEARAEQPLERPPP